MSEFNMHTNEAKNEPQTSNDTELFSEDEIMIALLDERSKSTFLKFLDRQLRASEHHYFEHGDQFSLGYLEAMQDMYSLWRGIAEKVGLALADTSPAASES